MAILLIQYLSGSPIKLSFVLLPGEAEKYLIGESGLFF
jgi:hypothetical protein